MQIDYAKLVEAYNQSLHNQLRNFSTGHDFLETWVPDEDPNRSLFGIFEAADVHGLQNSLEVRLTPELAKKIDLDWLHKETASFGSLETKDTTGFVSFSFRFERKTETAPAFDSFRPTLKTTETSKTSAPVTQRQNTPKHSPERPVKEVHARYLETLLKAETNIQHEGTLEQDEKLEAVHTTYGQIQIGVLLNKKEVIQSAKHQGAKKLDRVLVDCFCQTIQGLSLQEASDHGVIRLEYKLRQPNAENAIEGILTPENGDPAFATPTQLIRQLYQQRLSEKQLTKKRNFWTDRIDSDWLQLSDVQRKEKIQNAQKDFCREWGLQESIDILEIKNDTRVILHYTQETGKPDLSAYLIKMEKALHRTVNPNLELLLAEKEDINKPREQNVQKKGSAELAES